MIAQLRETAGEFERRGVRILIVESNDAYRIRYVMRRAQRAREAPARPIDEWTAGMGAWLGKSGEPALTVVTDPTFTAAASYGVALGGRFNAGGELFHRPATFLIDRDGVIRFMADYKDTESPDTEALLAVIDDIEARRALITALGTKSAELRGAVDLVLQPTLPGAIASLPILSRALGDEDAGVRAGAAAALCWLGARAAPAVEPLARALADADDGVRYQSAAALAHIGPSAAKAVPSLIAVMKEADARVRGALEQALRESPRPTHLAFPSVSDRISLADEAVRFRAMTIAALERIGTAAAVGLIDELDQKDPRVRLSIVEALGRFQPDAGQVGPALGRIVRHDPDARIREAAVRALRLHFDPVLVLVAALQDDDAVVREEATSALERTGGLEHWDGVLALVKALSDPDRRVRDGAFYALDHRADGTVPTLVVALGSADAETRLRAVELMALLWDRAIELHGGRLVEGLSGQAVPALRAAQADPDPRVRQAAARALSSIAAPRRTEDGKE